MTIHNESRYGSAPFDARDNLGYGRLKPSGFNSPRSFIQYPPETIEEEEGLVDEETYEVILNKLLNYYPGDPYAINKTDPFYFVAGNTKLSELSTSKGMVPFPSMYNNKQAVAGGTAQRMPAGPTIGFRTRIKPTGTKKGFSSPPYPHMGDDIPEEEKFTLSDILDNNSDEEHLKNVKELISMIHKEQNV